MSNINIPRLEHPRPQFFRDNWINLNGQWTYTFDFGCSGMDAGRELYKSQGFDNEITVPFCPESELSGVGHKDFIPAMWYQRTMTIPDYWDGKRVLLHFGAVDYECEVFIDGTSMGTHFGGSVSFSFDISRHVTAGSTHHLVVRVKDDTRDPNQPVGKQSPFYNSYNCRYTRTTGIWQTVWLEAVHRNGLKDIHVIPDYDSGTVNIIPGYHALKSDLRLLVTPKAGG